MIFSNLFRRRKQREDQAFEDLSSASYDQSEYAQLETKNIVKELNLSDSAQAQKYVMDLCKQMVQASKDIDDIRSEYQLVTNYLTDIQTLEDLPEDEKKSLLDCATHVAKLEKQRTDFLKTERRLTDTQFAQMQDEEENLPGIIRRLKANEADLDAIKRNLAFIEGKKLEWAMQRADAERMEKVMRMAAFYLLAGFGTLFALLASLSWYLQKDFQLMMTILGFAAVGSGVFVLVRYQESTRCIRQADVNRNHAVTLENRVKIRFVNTKNAVDFTCEKYHVHNAKELEFLYEQYQEEAREKEKFRKTSDDLEYYTQSLLQQLTALRLYDTRVWLNHANALIDSREMVELKHELLTRRQKLRGRMEYTMGNIHEMKGEALKNMGKLGKNNAYQLEQIIRKIEAMHPALK